MGAIVDLWKCERGLLAVLLVAAAGVLTGLGNMETSEWTDFAKWIFVTYAASKTVTGAVQITKDATVQIQIAKSNASATAASTAAPTVNSSVSSDAASA
jgi:hypothetical protein